MVHAVPLHPNEQRSRGLEIFDLTEADRGAVEATERRIIQWLTNRTATPEEGPVAACVVRRDDRCSTLVVIDSGGGERSDLARYTRALAALYTLIVRASARGPATDGSDSGAFGATISVPMTAIESRCERGSPTIGVRLGSDLRARSSRLATRLATSELAVHVAAAALLAARIAGSESVTIVVDRVLAEATIDRSPRTIGTAQLLLTVDLAEPLTGADLVRRAGRAVLACTPGPGNGSDVQRGPVIKLSLAQPVAQTSIDFAGVETFVPVVGDPDVDLRLEWLGSGGQRAALPAQESADAYETLLDSLVDEADAPTDLLEWVPEPHKALLKRWNGATLGPASPSRLEDVVGRGDGPLGLARIDAIAERLQERGVRAGQCVAVQSSASDDTLAAHLGVLRCGAICMPLDPSLDDHARRNRLRFGAADLLWVCDSLGDDASWELQPLNPAPGPDSGATQEPARADPDPGPSPPAGTAYCIVEPGAAGGLTRTWLGHDCLCRTLQTFANCLALRSSDRLLVLADRVDFAVFEALAAHAVGAQVDRVEPRDARDAVDLARLVAAAAPTLIVASQCAWRHLMAAQWRAGPGVRGWIPESWLDARLARYLVLAFEDVRYYQGALAAGSWSTAGRLEAGDPRLIDADVGDDEGSWRPIGMTLPNRSAWVLDHRGRLCPFGVEGDLWLGGESIASGHHGSEPGSTSPFRPDLLGERRGRKLIRAGFRARYRASGVVERRDRDRVIGIDASTLADSPIAARVTAPSES